MNSVDVGVVVELIMSCVPAVGLVGVAVFNIWMIVATAERLRNMVR